MKNGKAGIGIWIERGIESAGSLLVLIVTIITISQVMLRYVFKIPFEWSEELSRILFIWIVWLGAIVGIPKGRHMYIEFFRDRFFPNYSLYIELVMDLLGIFFLVIVTLKGYSLAEKMAGDYYLTINISVKYVFSSCVVGGILMLFYMGIQAKNTLQKIIDRKKMT